VIVETARPEEEVVIEEEEIKPEPVSEDVFEASSPAIAAETLDSAFIEKVNSTIDELIAASFDSFKESEFDEENIPPVSFPESDPEVEALPELKLSSSEVIESEPVVESAPVNIEFDAPQLPVVECYESLEKMIAQELMTANEESSSISKRLSPNLMNMVYILLLLLYILCVIC
jgi:hypothetical protein